MWVKFTFYSMLFLCLLSLLFLYHISANQFLKIRLRIQTTGNRIEQALIPSASSHSLKVLYWTRFNEHPEWFGKGALDNCPWKCHTIKNKQDLGISDAVLVHMRDIYDTKNLPQTPRILNQTWILYMRESPEYTDMPYTGYRPFNNKFNISMTYKMESEIHIPFFVSEKTVKDSEILKKNYAKGKPKLVAWFVSNCFTPSKRENYVQLLKEHIDIDIYGRCTQKKCNETSTCDEHLRNYKFYLAFENSLCSEYVTEKVERAYMNNVVPIVLGGAKYSHHLPPNSYINVANFSSPQKLAQYLHHLDNDDDLYNSYFKWKQRYRIRRVHGSCAMCKYLHAHFGEKKTLHRPDLLWNRHKDCRRPDDFYKSIANVSDMKTKDKKWKHCFDSV